MTPENIAEVLRAHNYCWHGQCTDRRGKACGWKARRRSRPDQPDMGEQHVRHVAEQISQIAADRIDQGTS